MRNFVGIDLGVEAAPDETTVCKFRHLLEKNKLGRKSSGSDHGKSFIGCDGCYFAQPEKKENRVGCPSFQSESCWFPS
jgi:hypothetical protein